MGTDISRILTRSGPCGPASQAFQVHRRDPATKKVTQEAITNAMKKAVKVYGD
jgi:hypothetical protein